MSSRTDILIVGGGVIGLTLAYLLARESVAVTLLDQGDLGQEASWAGAGILPAGNPRRAHSPMGKLRSQAVAFFPEFSEELKSLTGIDNGYWKCGGLELRCTADHLEKKRLEHLAQVERGEGLLCEILDARQLRELEPHLSPALPGAIYFPDVAQIRNPRHLQALIAAAEQTGVRLLPRTACQAMVRSGERITHVSTAAGDFTAGRFVIAAGTWTTGLLAGLGWQPAIAPIKGQIVLLHPPEKLLGHILLMGHRYLVPRQDGRLLIGSTEEQAGFDKSTTGDARQDLMELAERTIPGLAVQPMEKHWAGLRPGSPDGKPYLGLVPGLANLYVAAGHFRSGLQLSILTGMLMRDLLLGRGDPQALVPFRPDRPHSPSQQWIAHAQ